MVTFSDYGNVLGQVHTIYGLVGVGEDQAVPWLGVPVFIHGPRGQKKPLLPSRERGLEWSD